MDEFRRHPFALVGTLAAIGAFLMLAVAFDHAVRQAKDPDSLAVAQCAGAMGGGPPGSSDTSACYTGAVARSPLEAAGWWLGGGLAATAAVGGSIAGAVRRSRNPQAVPALFFADE